MEKTQIQKKIADLLTEHVNCLDTGHMLCIVDKEIKLIHNERTNIAPLKICKLNDEQINKGLMPDEWSRIICRAKRLLANSETPPQ